MQLILTILFPLQIGFYWKIMAVYFFQPQELDMFLQYNMWVLQALTGLAHFTHQAII